MAAVAFADSDDEQRERSDCRAGECRQDGHGAGWGECHLVSLSVGCLPFMNTKVGSKEAGTNDTA
jgi:hypothetical protein